MIPVVKANGLFDKHMKCIIDVSILYTYLIYMWVVHTSVLYINLICDTYVILLKWYHILVFIYETDVIKNHT